MRVKTYKSMKFLAIVVALLLPIFAFGQQQPDDAEMEKQLRESIDKEVERYTSLLDLEDWQVFYMDSILNHNYMARKDEMVKLNDAKVSNFDAYTRISDKWIEATYVAIQKILDEDQWTKYLKAGALKEKKARDKRAAKYQQ